MEKPQPLAGRYEVDTIIGFGGMGTVSRAKDLISGKNVAVKKLKSDVIALDSTVVERFRREAEALSQLNHPNIVKVFDTFEEDDEHYLVMEYVKGGTLADMIDESGKLTVKQTLDIGIGLADALARAHHLKIIHRDLKPVNVLIADDGTPRLSDFGVALLSQQDRMTSTGMTVGTLDYLSPEAINGEAADARADIWSLGLMLYEMLAGISPFKGDTPTATMVSILRDPVPNIVNVREDAPPALIQLIDHMLVKERENRISSARLVGAELEAIQNGSATPLGTRWKPTPVPSDTRVILNEAPITASIPAPSSSHIAIPPRKFDPRLLGTIGAIAVLVITVFLIGTQMGQSNTPSATDIPATSTPRPIVAENIPDDWKTIQHAEYSMAIPATWLDVSDSTLLDTMGQQVFAQADSSRAPQFFEFVTSLIGPERNQIMVADPVQLSFVILSEEPSVITVTQDIVSQRIKTMLGDLSEEYGDLVPVTLNGIPAIRNETPDFPIAGVNTISYTLILPNKIVWIVGGSANPMANFEEVAQRLETIISSLRIDEGA